MAQENETYRRDAGAPKINQNRGGPMGGGPMGRHPGMGVEKPKSFRKAMRTFLKYLAPYRVQLVFVLIFAIASTVFMVLGPKMLGNATTKLFAGAVAKIMHVPGAAIDFTYIGNIALMLLGLYVLSAVFSFLQGYIMSGIAMKITYQFRKNIAEKIKSRVAPLLEEVRHWTPEDVISMTETIARQKPEAPAGYVPPERSPAWVAMV